MPQPSLTTRRIGSKGWGASFISFCTGASSFKKIGLFGFLLLSVAYPNLSTSDIFSRPRFSSNAIKISSASNNVTTAVFFSVNDNKYGIVSISNSSQRINDVLNEIDTLWVKANWISTPHPRQQVILDTIREKKENVFDNGAKKTVKLLITDSADYGSGFSEPGSSFNKCILAASQLLGADNVYIASRALVSGRDLSCFDDSTRCSTKTFLGDVNGTVLNYMNSDIVRHIHNGVVAKWDFCVRSEYLKVFDEIISEKLDLKNNTEVSAADFSNYEKVRVKDVAYLWDEKDDELSSFRNKVTTFMKTVTHQNNLTGLIGMVSEGGRVGRRTTSKLYANALLEHKIIILAQRDYWEDHLRLFEALSSGALVLSDPITFPPAGLVDGKNIIFYNSLEDLAEKILYYLKNEKGSIERDQIAEAGRQLVLSHQLSHHRFERLMLNNNWPRKWTNPVAPLLGSI